MFAIRAAQPEDLNAVRLLLNEWPGQPLSAHWGFQDPASATGTDEIKRHVFARVCREIKSRLNIFLF